MTSRAVVHGHVVSPAAPGSVAKLARRLVGVVTTGNRHVMKTTVGLDGMTIDTRTDLHGGTGTTEKRSIRVAAVAVAHARRTIAAANRATSLAVLHHLEKSGAEIVLGRGLEEDDVSVIDLQHVAVIVPALGVPTTLIAMYQVVVVQLAVLPVNAKIVETANARTVGLASVTTAAIVHEATVRETMTVGMAVGIEEVGV